VRCRPSSGLDHAGCTAVARTPRSRSCGRDPSRTARSPSSSAIRDERVIGGARKSWIVEIDVRKTMSADERDTTRAPRFRRGAAVDQHEVPRWFVPNCVRSVHVVPCGTPSHRRGDHDVERSAGRHERIRHARTLASDASRGDELEAAV